MSKDKLVAVGAAVALTIHPVYVALVILMVFDIITGLGKAVVTKTVSSSASRVGMMKKAMVLMLVATAEVAQRLLGVNLPADIGVMIATMFCVTEITSILENVKACGVPIPDVIMNKFSKPQEKQ